MLLYTDVITNDELASDAYDPKLVDDIVYEIDCAQIIIKEGEVNIGELVIQRLGSEIWKSAMQLAEQLAGHLARHLMGYRS